MRQANVIIDGISDTLKGFQRKKRLNETITHRHLSLNESESVIQ